MDINHLIHQKANKHVSRNVGLFLHIFVIKKTIKVKTNLLGIMYL